MSQAASSDQQIASKPVRGFPGLRCPKCGNENTLSVDLDYVASLRCTDCTDETTISEIQELLEKWQAFLSWIELTPVVLE